jgi:hypothetical protein
MRHELADMHVSLFERFRVCSGGFGLRTSTPEDAQCWLVPAGRNSLIASY